VAIGTGSLAQTGTVSTAGKGVGVFNNAVVIGNASIAMAGTNLLGAFTGNGKSSVALGNNKYVHH
jgi:hypothetical protein